MCQCRVSGRVWSALLAASSARMRGRTGGSRPSDRASRERNGEADGRPTPCARNVGLRPATRLHRGVVASPRIRQADAGRPASLNAGGREERAIGAHCLPCAEFGAPRARGPMAAKASSPGAPRKWVLENPTTSPKAWIYEQGAGVRKKCVCVEPSRPPPRPMQVAAFSPNSKSKGGHDDRPSPPPHPQGRSLTSPVSQAGLCRRLALREGPTAGTPHRPPHDPSPTPSRDGAAQPS